MSTITDPEFPKINMVGYKFKVDCGEDLSTATVLELAFLKPNGSAIKVSATIIDTQYLSYATSLNVSTGTTILDMAGSWAVCPYIETPTFTGYGDTTEFIVLGEYE
jgi:hypothetical protein